MNKTYVNINSVEKVKSFVNKLISLLCDADLVSGRYVVDAKSIMGIFSLDLSKPVELRLYAQSYEIEKALDLVKEFITVEEPQEEK